MTEKEESNSKSENPTVEEKKEPKISLMKKGDYTVHILLEEVKNLILPSLYLLIAQAASVL